MIDTIRLYQPSFFSHYRGSIDFERFNVQNSVNNEVIYFNTFYNEEGKASINIKYNKTRDYVTITFSVPKISYGTSMRDFDFTDASIELLISNLSNRLAGLIKIDLGNSLVSRLDIALNISTEYVVGAYLRLIRYCLDISKRYKVQEFKDSSVTIYNNSKRIIFYDKEAEQLRLKELEGDYNLTGKVLRFEIQLKDMQTIRRELKLGKGGALNFVDALFVPRAYANYLLNSFRGITKDYALNSDVKEFQGDLGLMKAVSKGKKRGVLQDFLVRKYVKDLDIKTYETLLSYLGYSERSIYYMGKKLRELEAICPDNEDFDLIKEIDKKLEINICKFTN